MFDNYMTSDLIVLASNNKNLAQLDRGDSIELIKELAKRLEVEMCRSMHKDMEYEDNLFYSYDC